MRPSFSACGIASYTKSLLWSVYPDSSRPISITNRVTVLGICILQLKNKEESASGMAVMQVVNVASTVWPLAFAAVVGPMAKTLALYQAERGTTLGVKWQMCR